MFRKDPLQSNLNSFGMIAIDNFDIILEKKQNKHKSRDIIPWTTR